MTSNSIIPSPFAYPMPNVRIKEGAPPISRPTAEEIDAYPAEAVHLLTSTWQTQQTLLQTSRFDLAPCGNKHFLLAGATGPGIGGALAIALLHLLDDQGSLTVIGRDLTKSVNFETGKAMQEYAESAGFGNRFHWLNAGMALEGRNFEKIIAALQEAGAKQVVYVNTVAAANSGLLPGMPPVYVKDVDEEGLFQWQLTPLDQHAIDATRTVMGTMAVAFPDALAAAGITVELSVFADWRGSVDKPGRDPNQPEYGRQGAYSTSLYLPKEIIQQAVSQSFGSDKKMIDIFYPVMRTRALPFIPGGPVMATLYDKLMAKENIRRIDQPELALQTLQLIAHSLIDGGPVNPFPRLDTHEIPLDMWFYEIIRRINTNPASEFYYRHWLQA